MRSAMVCAAAVLGAAAQVLAQSQAGPEFRVGADTTADDGAPAVAMDAAGSFVVAWPTFTQTESGWAVRARFFDAGGAPVTDDVTVAEYTSLAPIHTHVARDGSGDAVVVWDVQSGLGETAVFGRRVSASGTPLGSPFRLDSATTGRPHAPVVAAAGDGSFVVVWSDIGNPQARVQARRFGPDGSPRGAEFDVDSGSPADQRSPFVAGDTSGNFTVVWMAHDRQVFGRRFSAAGTPIDAPFRVSESTIEIGEEPTVHVQASGRFVVAWRNAGPSPALIMARRYAADAMPLGGELLVRQLSTQGSPARPAVASTAGDGFVVAWANVVAGSSQQGVEARRFDATGRPVGRARAINTPSTSTQSDAALASDASGNVVAVWHSGAAGEGDVLGQRFGRLGAAGLEVDTFAGSTSDGNGVLEPDEIAELRPSWQNNTEAARALDGVLAEMTGPPVATYTIHDGNADYGTVPLGATRRCNECYLVQASVPQRTVTHIDALATESIGDGSEALVRWPVHVGESFADVPRSSPFYRSVETLLHHGVSGGCGARLFCPGSLVTREQLAVLVLAASEPPPLSPPPCVSAPFTDVPASSAFCPWIALLAGRGVIGGCDGGRFCPHDHVTREQTAVILLRTLDPALSPPACTTPMFNDVPASSPFCRWVEELARRGITAGCGGGNYCPGQPVTREQMAVFLTTTFGLTLYGPL